MSIECSHEKAIRAVRPSARGCEECLKPARSGCTCGYAGRAATSAVVMTRRIATLPSISMRPDTQSSKATIRQKDGDGAISTKFFWTCPIAQRLSSVQFHAIIDAMPSTHNREDLQMTHITYEIVEHDDGWR